MEEIKQFVRNNRVAVFCGIGVALFLLGGCLPLLDFGIFRLNGFNVIFGGGDLTAVKVVLFFMLLVPACLTLTTALNIAPIQALKPHLPLIHCVVSFVMCLVFLLLLPTVQMASVCVYLYLVVAAIGAVLAFIAEKR